MGIVNVTADSFSDGGRWLRPRARSTHARRAWPEGADMPRHRRRVLAAGRGAVVPRRRSSQRVVPVVEALAREGAALGRHDEAEVMRAALAAGADMINDVARCRAGRARGGCRASGRGVCLMHMQGRPRTMQADPRYDDVVGEVRDFLAARAAALEAAGIARERIVSIPGFGFGKTLGTISRCCANCAR
jgi:dihydropteroate synthase